jgi:hypothetical protein
VAITPLEKRLENERLKQASYDSKKVVKHKIAVEKRQGRPKSTWSISDVCMEIAEIASNIWSLPPWRLSESRLVVAFTQLRRKWGTNGEIEMQAFEFFMRRINVEEYPSVDALWQSFVYQFPEILPKVRLIFPTAEEKAAAKLESDQLLERQMSRLREDLKSGPTREDLMKRKSDKKRLEELAHHFAVLSEECVRSDELSDAAVYKKASLAAKLKIAVLIENHKDADILNFKLNEMNEIQDIPEGSYLIEHIR